MTRAIALFLAIVSLAGCSRKQSSAASALKPTAFGVAITLVSGDKQIASVGSTLSDPVVFQVNDANGTAVPGALVEIRGGNGMTFQPSSGLTDSSGQFSTVATVGGAAARYRMNASTPAKSGKPAEIAVEQIALGYEQNLGRQLSATYCDRCHDPESTPERVSNFDNLDPKPHAFSDGATLNKLSDADLAAIIAHGGPALGRSAQMPPYGYTFSKSELQALAAYIRAVADPPYHTSGVVYAKQ